jgi:hypothetical protein
MTKLLQKDLLQKALLARGYTVVESKTAKYVTMAKGGDDLKFYIGKSGGLRRGTKISESRSMPEVTRQRLLTEGAQVNA